MDNRKKLRRRAFSAVWWCLLALLLLTAASFAWINFSSSTYVTPIAGTVSEGGVNLLVSSAEGGPFGETCDLALTNVNASLQPISTLDLNSFYSAAFQSSDGITQTYESLGNRADQYAIHGSVYLRADGPGCSVYLFRDGTELTAPPQTQAALRLGLKITSREGTRTLILRGDSFGNTASAEARRTVPESGKVVAALDGDRPVYADDPAVSSALYFAGGTAENPTAGQTALLTLTEGETASIEFWVYPEGCDDYSWNPIRSTDVSFRLGFAGVGAH